MFGEKFGSLSIHFSRNTSIISSLNIPVLNIDRSHGNEWKYMEVNVDVADVFKVRNLSVLLGFCIKHFRPDPKSSCDKYNYRSSGRN
jgi:hypothetical protein